jgi:hypothetical protein
MWSGFDVYNKRWYDCESCLILSKLLELEVKFILKNPTYIGRYRSVSMLFHSEN